MEQKTLPQKAADRVRSLFNQGNLHLFYTLTSQLPEHHYDLVQIPRVPPQLGRLSLSGLQMKTPPQKKRNWDNEKRQKGRSLLFQDRPTHQRELNPHRVKLCKLKEHYLASRKFKTISKQKKASDHPLNHQVQSLAEPKEALVDERMDFWQAMLQQKEERHFNIGRIIKYLSD
jgi:hypothetical protein